MADIHIHRDHTLGLASARTLASQWVEQAEQKFGLVCTHEKGETSDRVNFTRSGVSGEILVTPGSFELNARLGFVLSAFKDRIESEIVKNLDALLAIKAGVKKTAAGES